VGVVAEVSPSKKTEQPAERPARSMAVVRPRVRSMSDQVTETLRSMILVGDLRSGDQVTQEKLAEDLGVSTMPVREALLRLSHEGFVRGGRGRSFRIAPTTREDIEDIYWVHATLAGELTARACTRIDDRALAEVARVHDNWLTAVSGGNVAALERENFEFHRLINLAAGSPKLLMLLRNTLRLIPEHFYSLLPGWMSSSTRGHEEILAALSAHDADTARKAASQHVLEAGRMLVEYFDEQGFWTVPHGR